MHTCQQHSCPHQHQHIVEAWEKDACECCALHVRCTFTMFSSLQSDVVHQFAVRIPLEEVVKGCSNKTAAAKFKEDVEELPPPEDMYESSEDGMDHDAGASLSLDEGSCLTKWTSKFRFLIQLIVTQHSCSMRASCGAPAYQRSTVHVPTVHLRLIGSCGPLNCTDF